MEDENIVGTVSKGSVPDFKTDLIEFYRQEHSIISVSPLVEEHVVPLVEFYVKPPLVAVDLQHPFGNPTKTPVLNYEQLFCQETGKVHKNIYVTSSAGMGKTSFCKHICMTWCQAHNPVVSMNDKFQSEDIRALKGFDFLFYLTLRDVHGSLCHLDDLIDDFIKDNLSTTSSDQQLLQILKERSCLVVIDGLDEWVHPKECKKHKQDHDIPHRKYRKNWTTLTTTRSWTFDILHLPSNQIDSHIELKELHDKSSDVLVKNAMIVLNIRYKSCKTVEEFYGTTSLLKLGEIRKIPYLHLYCLCLWYDGRDIGYSKCEIYSNMLELTLHRGTVKLQPESFPASIHQDQSPTIPKCMYDKEYCNLHWSLLMKIGELAFYALCGSENIQMLVMDYKFAVKYITLDELKTCLKFGLLSKNKVYGPVSTRISNVSFQHKTIQEYLAALYMQSTLLSQSSVSQSIHQLTVSACTSLSNILNMSEIFIFLSGLNSVAYREISLKLINIVNEDENTQIYRSCFHVNYYSADFEVMFKYQTLQVHCLEEMHLNKQDFHPLPLKDVIINELSKQVEYVSYIQKLIQANGGSIKFLHVTGCENTEEVTDILNMLDLRYFHSLEKIDIRAVARQTDIERLLIQSVNTLKCLVIHNANIKDGIFVGELSELSQVCLDTVVSMPSLKSLFLGGLILTHTQLESLTTFLTSRVTMVQIYIHCITCSEHQESCPGVQFHLSGHENLQLLGMIGVPISQLHFNPQPVNSCLLGLLPPSVFTSWLIDLPSAHNLQSLYCNYLSDPEITTLKTIIPSLLQLEELYIRYTDFTDNSLVITTDMTRLKLIQLYEVSLRSSSLRGLIDTLSSLPQSVTIGLLDCTVEPAIEYQTLREDIKRSESFSVIFDRMSGTSRKTFKFQTVK